MYIFICLLLLVILSKLPHTNNFILLSDTEWLHEWLLHVVRAKVFWCCTEKLIFSLCSGCCCWLAQIFSGSALVHQLLWVLSQRLSFVGQARAPMARKVCCSLPTLFQSPEPRLTVFLAIKWNQLSGTIHTLELPTGQAEVRL